MSLPIVRPRSSVPRALALLLVVAPLGAALAQQPTPLTPLDAPPRASSMVLRLDPVPNALAGVPVESLPPFPRPNGMLLRPGTFVYQLSSRRDSVVTPLGVRTVSVSETVFAGSPSWLIAESRTGTAVTTTDSLFLTRADLWPERWVATNGRAQLAASFGRDSMYVAMQSYQGRSSLVTALPRGALFTAGMVERIIELLPLEVGYRTGANLVLFALGAPRVIPAELRVDRVERVELPDRTVDAWVVVLRVGELEERLWVGRDDSRVVKTEQETGAGLLTAVLLPPAVVPMAVPPARPAMPQPGLPPSLPPARPPAT